MADTANHTIRKVVSSTGAVTTLAGTAGSLGASDGTGPAALFHFPQSVAADGAGNLFVADWNNNTIRQVVLATGAVTTLAGNAAMAGSSDGTGAAALFNFPQGVAADGAGKVFVTDASATIRQIVVSTQVVTTLAGTAGVSGSSDGVGAAAQFSAAWGIAADTAGHVYVADTGNHTIRQVVVANRAVTTLAGAAGVSGSSDGVGPDARFNAPRGVALDGAGNPNGDSEPTDIGRLRPTRRSQNDDFYL